MKEYWYVNNLEFFFSVPKERIIWCKKLAAFIKKHKALPH
jgi:hypothetical protein